MVPQASKQHAAAAAATRGFIPCPLSHDEPEPCLLIHPCRCAVSSAMEVVPGYVFTLHTRPALGPTRDIRFHRYAGSTSD
ncbi:hypothetical protein D623_10032542 [Myotis brandtii]|uniref:Uncharacterized protein n=1 Tax=Myotis brandtii TaxID=109478 RepID=S7PB62_MYOBR|nr:hypothetical protein D623_10032542 [Myotis brandtii]